MIQQLYISHKLYISIKKQGKPDKKPGSIKAKKKCFIEGSRII